MGEFADLLNQTVRIRDASGQDSYAKDSYSDDDWATHQCRVSGKVERVRTVKGEEVVSRYRITMEGNIDVSTLSQVEMPTGYKPLSPPIVHVGKFPDESGEIHHTTLYF